MSFFGSILDALSDIELHDYVKIIGKHKYKGKLGLVKQIKKYDSETIYVVEVIIDGSSLELTKANLLKYISKT